MADEGGVFSESPNKHEDARLFELSHKDAEPKEIKMKGARLLKQVEEMTTNEDVFLDAPVRLSHLVNQAYCTL